jgi:hypothetical protein
VIPLSGHACASGSDDACEFAAVGSPGECNSTGLQSVRACGLVGQVSLQAHLSGVLKEMEE